GNIHIFRTKQAAVGFLDLSQDRAAPISSGLQGFGGNRGPCGHGLQTAFVPARTQGSVLINTDMTNIAGTAVTATMDLAVGDDPGPDPRSDLDKDKVIHAGPIPRALFPQG